ncbi:glycosyltransferase [Lutimonas halocynthiae]|uniref:glycosyltransferase n=1 Tax=Lutimonas halocynthiae TaxID=1446477 RepID=UPI0025B3A6B5|nr:glycosyltransferase [Lutimonas halocynthiae]MDN3641811.1 glycosyltransferase [Lutimonas halocynthiae]
MKKVLIIVPELKKPGGVAALFNILKIEQNYSNISLFILSNKLPLFLRLPMKYIEFIIKIQSVGLVHLNPSLNRKSFLRDSLFAWLTLLFSKKLVVYWHGWDETYEKKIINNAFLKWVLKRTFLKAQVTIVLGKLFKSKLCKFGYNNRIVIETNSAENKYIINQHPKNINKSELINLLFLSRLEKVKGVYIAIETLRILNRNKQKYRLLIAGSGKEEEKIKVIIADDKSIEWVGYVTEISKHNLLERSNLMFFPSEHPEGLPLTLLEGMMYGLPILSRPVGGIPDIIINGENGYLLESLEPKDYASKIKELVDSNYEYNRISENNIEKSKIFHPENVRLRLNAIYDQI